MVRLSERLEWGVDVRERRVWPAPCKLNLFLHITGRRIDGYHTLQTLFQLLDYGDLLTFDIRADGVLVRSNEVAGVAEHDDLVILAARALREYVGRPELGAVVGVEKNIPLGGGLGGGSSDAATVLVALNLLWDLGLSRETLAQIGVRLGADVPLFVYGATAWGEGVGEVLTPLTLPHRWFVVVNPGCFVSTAQIFAAPGLTRDTPSTKITASYAGYRNDCEPVVRKIFPEVDQALRWLAQYGEARLTGTGASIFASFLSQQEAVSVLRLLPPGYHGFVARGVNESALNHCFRGVTEPESSKS